MKLVSTLVYPLVFLIGFYCSFGSLSVQAKEVDGLFNISVPVDNQSDKTRRLATRDALSEIVVRISGQSDAASNNIVASNLKRSSSYIQRYLYREEVILDEEGKDVKQLMLDLFFDESSLRNLLKDAGLPRWGSNRPQVLVWFAIGDQQQRFLIGMDDEPLYGDILNKIADSRGLPIIQPLMDLEDSIAIAVADVWGRFVQPIRQASSRYESDAILAAQLLQTGDGWETKWLLLHKGRTLSWELQSDSIESAITAGIESTTDQLAKQYAVIEDSLHANELLIAVSAINELEDYADLMDYLENLTSVRSVNVASVSVASESEMEVQLRLSLVGEQDALLQAISLNKRLYKESMPIYSGEGLVTQLPTLFFRWNSQR